MNQIPNSFDDNGVQLLGAAASTEAMTGNFYDFSNGRLAYNNLSDTLFEQFVANNGGIHNLPTQSIDPVIEAQEIGSSQGVIESTYSITRPKLWSCAYCDKKNRQKVSRRGASTHASRRQALFLLWRLREARLVSMLSVSGLSLNKRLLPSSRRFGSKELLANHIKRKTTNKQCDIW